MFHFIVLPCNMRNLVLTANDQLVECWRKRDNEDTMCEAQGDHDHWAVIWDPIIGGTGAGTSSDTDLECGTPINGRVWFREICSLKAVASHNTLYCQDQGSGTTQHSQHQSHALPILLSEAVRRKLDELHAWILNSYSYNALFINLLPPNQSYHSIIALAIGDFNAT